MKILDTRRRCSRRRPPYARREMNVDLQPACPGLRISESRRKRISSPPPQIDEKLLHDMTSWFFRPPRLAPWPGQSQRPRHGQVFCLKRRGIFLVRCRGTFSQAVFSQRAAFNVVRVVHPPTQVSASERFGLEEWAIASPEPKNVAQCGRHSPVAATYNWQTQKSQLHVRFLISCAEL